MRVWPSTHEVVVAVPARDDVTVEVVDAAAGDGGAEVESDVEGFRPEGARQELLAENDDVEKIRPLRRPDSGHTGRGPGESCTQPRDRPPL